MSSTTAFRPGIALGVYPERKESKQKPLEGMLHKVLGRFKLATSSSGKHGQRFVAAVDQRSQELKNLDDETFRQCCKQARMNLLHQGLDEGAAIEGFAMVREASGRVLGKRHFEVQLLSGWALLNGFLAEMQTGEGKTLTVLLPACTTAMAGIPVHVITANDYLAARDAELLRAVFEWFDLTIGVLTDEVQEPAERKDAYDCDVTYCSPRQVAFDYLRDRMTMGHRRDRLDLQLRALSGDDAGSPLLMRGLCFAIVDEADSVLIDDACTPLILSQTRREAPQDDVYVWALELASHFEEGQDFTVEAKYREALISYEGYAHMSELLDELIPPASAEQEVELLISQALQAIHCYQRDREYLVRAGRIEIIDGNTGRAQPDHAWERGLHQMIEAKEGCELTPQRETIARMSYQRFFRRYLHLGGMTGTASEVAVELWSVYRQQVVRIPTRVPSRRVAHGTTFYASADDKWQGVAGRAEALQRSGRPTLIGTQSVEETELLSAILAARGVAHKVLNARQDKEEADIVAGAGQPGAVTVATNMAGRGTDIELPAEVVDAGGLHVIVAGRNDSRRVDRQFVGRCARQGDPGSFEFMLSFEDELLKKQLPTSLLTLIHTLSRTGIGLPRWLLMRGAQTLAERHGAAVRRGVLRFDDQMTERLAFSGPIE